MPKHEELRPLLMQNLRVQILLLLPYRQLQTYVIKQPRLRQGAKARAD